MTTIQHREHSVSPTCNFTAGLPPPRPPPKGGNPRPPAPGGPPHPPTRARPRTRPPTGPVHNGDNALPAAAVGTAIRLIGAVHEHGPDDVAHILTDLNNQDLLALAVTLAAMVPDDYSPVELLAWNDSRYAPVVSTV